MRFLIRPVNNYLNGHGHACRHSDNKIANLELLAQRYFPEIFPRLVHVSHLNYIIFDKRIRKFAGKARKNPL